MTVAKAQSEQGSQFWDGGYTLVEGLLDETKLDFATRAIDASDRQGVMRRRTDPFLELADDEYSPVFGEILLRHCRPRIEAVIGRPLLETCAYWRIYRAGSLLQPHRDRVACEISATLTISSEPEGQAWPIFVEDLHGTEVPVTIPPGSGLVYQGAKVKHWREPLPSGSHRQLLLHYVLKDGRFRDHVFDKRDTDPIMRRAASESD
ncbi:hypothetical protein AAG612_13060 [Citromicrobium bathyomarinum]|uniref:hypothetical protein n=1 Tax=Citromicrobium bathyomarinum TaxID=72174 RepID=UPI00315A156B